LNVSIAITKKKLFKALQLTQPEETGYCFNIILILSEFLEPTKDEQVQVSSELALYAVFLLCWMVCGTFSSSIRSESFSVGIIK